MEIATKTLENRQPGDLTRQQLIERMVRVNHAGEYGAKRIYAGQLAVLKNQEERALVQHMADQEEAHLDYFSKEVGSRQVRPTALMPIWHVLGFALGAGTALLGKKAAMACTVAVEEVIDAHYKEQLAQLGQDEQPLKDAIARFREEELEHRAIGLEHEAEQAIAYPLLTTAVKTASRAAIWLSSRV